MIAFFTGWGISAMMGGGTMFIVLFLLGLAYPKVFKAFYWLLMLPVYWGGSFTILWIFLPLIGIGSWGSSTFAQVLAAVLFVPSVAKIISDLDF